uniref:Cas12f1-like TNB domain-containing protein n=1 Tax=viral metagenome TaxID=1070528 RepID=A0A6C0C5G4_9ZZZZ
MNIGRRIASHDTISPIFSTNSDCKLTDWIPPVLRIGDYVSSKSWFDVKILDRTVPELVDEGRISYPIIPHDSLIQQNKSIGRKKASFKRMNAKRKRKKLPPLKITNRDKLEPAFITTKKIRIHPTKEQKFILDSWLRACTDMFNITVKFIESRIYCRDYDGYFILDIFGHKILVPNIENILLDFKKVRSFLKTERDGIIQSLKHKIRTHIMDEAIAQAVACFKTSVTTMHKISEKQNKFIEDNPSKPIPVTPTFRIRPLKHSRPRRVLKLEPACFNRLGTFCFPIFNQIKPVEKIKKFSSTVTLLHDKASKKYILLVPIRNKPKENRIKKQDALGIDLGVRTFITAYSKNRTWSICSHSRQWKLQNYIRKIDGIKRALTRIKNKFDLKLLEDRKISLMDRINKSRSNSEKEQLRCKEKEIDEQINVNKEKKHKMIDIINERNVTNKTRRAKKNITHCLDIIREPNKCVLTHALKKYEIKKQNLVKDMHYKAANFLVKDYDRIYIGNLSTRKIVSRNNVTITKNTKKTILALAPYKFKQILKHMGNKNGCIVEEVSEYLTTKTCSNCGNMYEIGSSKIYKCGKCGMEADRDENSAKTHLKLGLKKEILALVNSRPRKRQVDKEGSSKGN